MLTIGHILPDKWAQTFGDGIDKLISHKTSQATQTLLFNSEKELLNALAVGEIAVAPRPLWQLPTFLPKGIVITALSDRISPSYSLIIPRKNVVDTQLLSLKDKARVAFLSDICRLQSQEFRPDLQTTTLESGIDEIIPQLNKGDFDACVIPSMEVQIMDVTETDYQIIRFNPKELIPEAGFGVTAFLTAEDDITTRRWITSMDKNENVTPYKPISTVTNVERRLKQLFNDMPIAAYCERDRASNYHFLAAVVVGGILRKARLSQSTNFELAERCYEKLISSTENTN